MDRIVVVGGGGHAKVVISILKKLSTFEIFGYVDPVDRGNILDTPYLGDDVILKTLRDKENVTHVVIGVGQIKDYKIRYSLMTNLKSLNYILPPIISPNAIVNENVTIGEGTVIMDGVIINTGTVVGNFSILNTKCSVDHDCKVGDFVHVAPGVTISGSVEVNSYSLIGVGSTIIHNQKVGKNCIISAGSVVTTNCSENAIYRGVPARRIK